MPNYGASPGCCEGRSPMGRRSRAQRLRCADVASGSAPGLLQLRDCSSPCWTALPTGSGFAPSPRPPPRSCRASASASWTRPSPSSPRCGSRRADLDLDYHLQRVVLPAPGGLRELLEHAQVFALTPFDKTRPLWEIRLVEGGEISGSALILKVHHAMTDGTGFMQLLALLQQMPARGDRRRFERTAGAAQRAAGCESTPRQGGTVRPRRRRSACKARATLADRASGRADSRSGLRGAFAPAPARPSPLLAGRTGRSWRFGLLECELADLKAASRSAGGSVNDGFRTALLDGIGRYHRRHGALVDEVTVMVPVDRRPDDELAGGNHMAGAFIAGPVADMPVTERMAARRRSGPDRACRASRSAPSGSPHQSSTGSRQRSARCRSTGYAAVPISLRATCAA